MRTACAGRVAFAGRVAGRPVVTVACGAWRATHLPVLRPRVTAGERVGPGRVLGVVGSDDAHTGLHLGIRRADLRFGYVDPWLLLSRARTADRPRLTPVPSGRPPRRMAPRSPHLVPRSAPVAPPAAGHQIAPLPVWIGLACLLLGCLAGGMQRRVRFDGTGRSPSTTAFTGHVRSRTRASSPPG
ncbi:MAG: Membrane proteins related to metalloendopeptidases [uncultured Solirubrobacteraceae bacterium]|uniref:Membrane proteins related to metalloendopeptidases n=1 Tax=uncultured Solirubrobacteraceae bacterium TaxID=1162706 RepID=A0A6J4S803_9ACTN|nr:MAG: Membrane proteins related to metalloendopeptidases [uncultured Solirubrobacteraceae bacterium]